MWDWCGQCGLWFRGVNQRDTVSSVLSTQLWLVIPIHICHSFAVLRSGWQNNSWLGVFCHLLVVVIVHLLGWIPRRLLQLRRVCLVGVVVVLVRWWLGLVRRWTRLPVCLPIRKGHLCVLVHWVVLRFGEAQYEGSVKVAETQKGTDILNIHWSGPVFNTLHFGRVHACHPLFKD